jgi:antirestriction protein ArdC
MFRLNKIVMKTIPEKNDMYAIISNMIMEKLQNGTAPWGQTWDDFGSARNYVSKKPYRGITAMILNKYRVRVPFVPKLPTGQRT